MTAGAPSSLVVLDLLEQAEALEERPLPDDVRPGFIEGLIATLRWVQGHGPAPELPVPTDQCTNCDGNGGYAVVGIDTPCRECRGEGRCDT